MTASEKAYDAWQRLDGLISPQTDWANLGSFSNGWGSATVARYRMGIGGQVEVQIQALIGGTTTNNTTILTSGNSVPAGFRPGVVIYKNVRCDNQGGQTSAIRIDTDGTMSIFGVTGTGPRVDAAFSYLAEN